MARKPDFEGGREERRNRGREVRKEGNLKIYLPTFFFFFLQLRTTTPGLFVEVGVSLTFCWG
jgi:hypothetical protein